MNRKFKSIVAVILTVLMLIPLAAPAFAADAFKTARSQVPIIYIAGDGESIYDKDGNELSSYTDVFSVLLGKMQDDEGDGKNEVLTSSANVLLPFLIEGLGTGNYDKYYEMLNKEISELFGDILLDKNGEATNGTGISQGRKNKMAYDLTVDYKNWRGYYTADDYHFWYDWRLDPLETADELYAFVQGVKKITGSPKVSLIGRCLGSTIVSAYLAKYGNDDIYGVALDIPVANGAEIFSEAISGQFKVDANAINRFIVDSNGYGANIDSFIVETIDLLEKAGVFDKLVGVTKETVYYVVLKGVTSALTLSTLGTWPSFWGIVSSDDYDAAMEYVFGDKNSAKRQEYAGLVEKIENYNNVVRKNIYDILKDTNEKANLCIVCKYGSQMVPVVESRNAIGDQYGSLAYSSYCATTADIYSTLSDEYIENRISEGKGKYIAPDKQVDASTCLFPDQTWFIKGDPHGDHSDVEFDIIYGVLSSDRQLTVDEYEYGQFIACNYTDYTFEKMTEENCDTYFWKAEQNVDEATGHSRIFYFLLSLFNWILSLFEKLTGK